MPYWQGISFAGTDRADVGAGSCSAIEPESFGVLACTTAEIAYRENSNPANRFMV
jgi:hypothetical protein